MATKFSDAYDARINSILSRVTRDGAETFVTEVPEGESLQDYSSTHRRIHGRCKIVTAISRDGGVKQSIYEA